ARVPLLCARLAFLDALAVKPVLLNRKGRKDGAKGTKSALPASARPKNDEGKRASRIILKNVRAAIVFAAPVEDTPESWREVCRAKTSLSNSTSTTRRARRPRRAASRRSSWSRASAACAP